MVSYGEADNPTSDNYVLGMGRQFAGHGKRYSSFVGKAPGRRVNFHTKLMSKVVRCPMICRLKNQNFCALLASDAGVPQAEGQRRSRGNGATLRIPTSFA